MQDFALRKGRRGWGRERSKKMKENLMKEELRSKKKEGQTKNRNIKLQGDAVLYITFHCFVVFSL